MHVNLHVNKIWKYFTETSKSRDFELLKKSFNDED